MDADGAEREISETCEAFQQDIVEVGGADGERAVSSSATAIAAGSRDIINHLGAFTIEQQEQMLQIHRNVISNQCDLLQKEVDMDRDRLATEKERLRVRAIEEKERDAAEKERLRAQVAAEQDKNRSKQSLVEAETKKLEREIELARINKEPLPVIVAKSSESHKRKREADTTNGDEEQLRDRTSAPYRGLRSLTSDVWQARPDDCSKSLISVVNEFRVWATNLDNVQGVKCDMRCIRVGKTNLDIVYCKSAVNTKPIVQSFWYPSPDTHVEQLHLSLMTDTAVTAPVPISNAAPMDVTTTGPASDIDAVAATTGMPIDPLAVITEPSSSSEMEVGPASGRVDDAPSPPPAPQVNVTTPPPAPLVASVPTASRSPGPRIHRSAPSMFEAAATGIAPEHRHTVLKMLESFVRSAPLKPYESFVWITVSDRVTHNIIDIETRLDVATHPLIPQLRGWIQASIANGSDTYSLPPIYPVPLEYDHRPLLEVTPADAFGVITRDDVWDKFGSIQIVNDSQRAFHTGWRDNHQIVQSVHLDRRIYWQQLTTSQEWFEWNQLCVMFGWQKVQSHHQVITHWTNILLYNSDRRIVDTEWHNKQTKPHTFKAGVCLWAMRRAVALQFAMIQGGLNADQCSWHLKRLREIVTRF